MNERIRELAEQCYNLPDTSEAIYYRKFDKEKFAELIVRECVSTLEFHGFDDAVPYIQWMATNKLGVKE